MWYRFIYDNEHQHSFYTTCYMHFICEKLAENCKQIEMALKYCKVA